MTDEEIKSLASRAGMLTDVVTNFDELKKFAELVAKHEREECAKLCDGLHQSFKGGMNRHFIEAAKAIRARTT